MNFERIVKKARTSRAHLWLLNRGLSRIIPFNRPHGFRITSISDYAVRTVLPYKKSNFNHIRGLHACALATLSEFTTGFLLLTLLDPDNYRIILKTLNMDYHYQGKSEVQAEFSVTPDWVEENITGPLREGDSVVVLCEVNTFDAESNHISTGKVHWQVKSWSKVRTKV